MENTTKTMSLKNSEVRSGIIYRNPVPHVFSRQAYFPSTVLLDNGDMLASFVIGEAFESLNLDTHIARSKDMGESWSKPVPLLPKEEKVMCSNLARLTALSDGEVVAIVVRSHRELHPEEGLANPETLGFVPTDLLLVRSVDNGRTWMTPETIAPPLEGPSFEACSSIVPLQNGRWLWPTSTWRGWDGYSPNGMKMIALVSYDQGKTWPEFVDIMDGNANSIIYWEGKIAELNNGLLVAVAWAHDEQHGKDLTNHYTISRDGGKTWRKPASTYIKGQTMSFTALKDNRLLIVYRRMDKPGLWVNISYIEGNTWVNEREFCLWGGQKTDMKDRSDNMVEDFNALKFGAPCITVLPDDALYITFWCYERMVSNIRWFKFSI